MNVKFDTNLDLHIPFVDLTSGTHLLRGTQNADPSGKFPPYLKTLHDITSSSETDNCIRWTKDGLHIYVADADGLCEEIERCKYFRSSKFASLVRNLNYYRFKKIKFEDLDIVLRCEVDSVLDTKPVGKSRHLFVHPDFQRGRPELLVNFKSRGASNISAKPVDKSSGPVKKKVVAAAASRGVEAENRELKRTLAEKEVEIGNLHAQLKRALDECERMKRDSNKRPRESETPLPPLKRATPTDSPVSEWSDLRGLPDLLDEAEYAALLGM